MEKNGSIVILLIILFILVIGLFVGFFVIASKLNLFPEQEKGIKMITSNYLFEAIYNNSRVGGKLIVYELINDTGNKLFEVDVKEESYEDVKLKFNREYKGNFAFVFYNKSFILTKNIVIPSYAKDFVLREELIKTGEFNASTFYKLELGDNSLKAMLKSEDGIILFPTLCLDYSFPIFIEKVEVNNETLGVIKDKELLNYKKCYLLKEDLKNNEEIIILIKYKAIELSKYDYLNLYFLDKERTYKTYDFNYYYFIDKEDIGGVNKKLMIIPL